MTLRRNKFNSKKTTVDGHTFDSQIEATRYLQLKYLQMAGEIRELQLQPKIPLMVNGKKIGTYIGDFKYIRVSDGVRVIEDVKSKATKTPVYNLKKKILATYEPPVIITEWMK